MLSIIRVLTSIAAALLLLLQTSCRTDTPPSKPVQDRIKCSQIIVPTDRKGEKYDTLQTCYNTRELVSNTTSFTPDGRLELLKFLRDTGFVVKDTCRCEQDLILWEWDKDEDIDLIGVIAKAPKDSTQSVGDGNGLDLNYFTLGNPDNRAPRPNDGKPEYSFPSQPTDTVIVGVVDAGTLPEPELQPFQRTTTGRSFCGSQGANHPLGMDMWDFSEPLDQLGHGVFVNGVVAGASTPSQSFHHNIAIELVNAKITEGASENINLFKAVCGIYYVAEQGAQVINLSWGYVAKDPPEILAPFLAHADTSGIVICAGAGNTGRLMQDALFWPAAYSRYSYAPGKNTVISVGALNQAGDALANISAYGDRQMDLAAPGEKVVSLYVSTSGVGEMTGTSVATGFVTRTAAVIRGLNPQIPATAIKDCILNGVDRIPASGLPGGMILVHNHEGAIQKCRGLNPAPAPGTN
jgi:subtilisin family serine protease